VYARLANTQIWRNSVHEVLGPQFRQMTEDGLDGTAAAPSEVRTEYPFDNKGARLLFQPYISHSLDMLQPGTSLGSIQGVLSEVDMIQDDEYAT
jgi:hypothetical protein